MSIVQSDVLRQIRDNGIKDAEETIEEYLTLNYDKENKKWVSDDPVKIEQNQSVIRKQRGIIREFNEFYEVGIGGPEAANYAPLVSLRFALSNDKETGTEREAGLLFVFSPESKIKHSVGNWNCQACLNTSLEKEDGTQKHIGWCPKFRQGLRHLSYQDYKAILPNECFAGLFHTEIEIGENPDTGVPLIKFTKKCDQCFYEEIEIKQGKTQSNLEEIKIENITQEDLDNAIKRLENKSVDEDTYVGTELQFGTGDI